MALRGKANWFSVLCLFLAGTAAIDVCANGPGGVTSLQCGTVLAHLVDDFERPPLPEKYRRYEKYLNVPLREVPFLGLDALAPSLRQDIVQLADRFEKNPEDALAHIVEGVVYSDWTSKSHKLNGGLHSFEGRRQLLELQFKDSGFSIEKHDNWDQIGRQQQFILANPKEWQFLEMKALGLSPEKLEDVYYYALAHHGSHIGPIIEPNGVIRFQFGRALFNTKKWKESVLGAEMGRAPAGAKTLFPASWNADKIKSAVSQVLHNPKTRLLALSSTDDDQHIRQAMVEGEVDGVVITVAIAGGKVVTAYPSWVQDRAQTVSDVLKQRNYFRSRSSDKIWDLAKELKVSAPISDVTDGIPIYAGRQPLYVRGGIPLKDSDYYLLNKYLNPAQRPNGHKDEPRGLTDKDTELGNLYRLGGATQHHIEHFLINWRLLEDVNTLTRDQN